MCFMDESALWMSVCVFNGPFCMFDFYFLRIRIECRILYDVLM